MRWKINAENPERRKINQVVKLLEEGGVIIYPTDTVYAFACDINNQKAIDKICKLRKLDPKKANLSMVCKDISQMSNYTQQIDNTTFRLLKKNLPGPFTFILPSSNNVPKLFKNKKRTLGLRVPAHSVPIAIVEHLGRPILTTSLKSDDEILEYFTDPEDIYADFKKLVDGIVDSGIGGNVPSTIVDCTDFEPQIIRTGAGILELA